MKSLCPESGAGEVEIRRSILKIFLQIFSTFTSVYVPLLRNCMVVNTTW